MLNSIVAAVVKWALSLLTSASVLGLAWCGGHHAGAQAQAAKDAPVIATSHAQAVTAKAETGLTTQALTHSAQRADHERAIQAAVQDSTVAIVQAAGGDQVVPPDVDAVWRGGIGGLRGDLSGGDRGSAGGAVSSGPTAQGDGATALVAAWATH